MRTIVVFVLLVLGIAGCIKNDIPHPVIYGNVQKIEFEGQQKCVVNTKTRTIEVVLSDTVDIRRVKLTKFEVIGEPAVAQKVDVVTECGLKVDTVLDLSQVVKFSISTYQEYDWTIVTEQPMEYFLSVVGQDDGYKVGINQQERMVFVYIPKDKKLSEVRIDQVQLGSSIATYSPDPANISDFTRGQPLLVSCFGRTEKWMIYAFHQPDGGGEGGAGGVTGTADAWAKSVVLNGNVPAGNGGDVAFEYRKARESVWKKVAAQVSGNKFSAKVTGLDASTQYVFRGIVGEETGGEVQFTTEAAEQVSGLDFDSWYMDGKAVCPGVEGVLVWDTGNKGGASFGFNPTTQEKSDVVKGSAARLASVYAAVKFAAGSIYTGSFGGLDGTNAKLNFGIPYTCRPTKMTGYFKYTPGVIDRVKTPYEYLMGRTDSCHIYVALCDWTEPFQANSKTSTFVDYSPANPTIIAYGELKTDRKMTSYEKFTIDINYRDTKKKPKFIVIVASSSKYGDYFSGSTSALLLIDEFELGFE